MPTDNIGTIYTPSIYGRKSFPLKHKSSPIFYKTFNPSSSAIVNLITDVITIPNHFFKTGEPLKYTYNSGDTPIGIDGNSPGAAGITTFPDIVYPVVVDKDRIRVALGDTYAKTNQYVDIVSLGIGTAHSFEAFKQNSKCLININGVIQSPISIASTVKVISYTSASLEVEKLENIKTGTCLKVNNELVRVSAINYSTKVLTISRGPDVLGSEIVPFDNSLNGSYIDILAGNYNIIKDILYFDEAPLENKTLIFKIPLTDIVFSSSSFNLITDEVKTGTQVLVIWDNPPQELPDQKFYYLIQNSPNNFSLANTFGDAFKNVKVTFSNTSLNGNPVSKVKFVYYYPSENNTFNGRVFLRSNYDGNQVFDDISEQFTGITSAFELKSSGISTVGIKSDNGILLLNNVFQYPGSDEAFSFVENASKTFINFVGFGTTGFTGKPYDINVKDYPRGGIIVSYGTTSGTNYQISTSFYNVPLSGSGTGIGASVSFDTDFYGNITNLRFVNRGYNYKSGDILIPSNTVGLGTQVQNDKLHITIQEVTKDTFNAWDVGILDKLDDLSSKVTGKRKTFNLTKNGLAVSLEADAIYEVELQYNLLVFVNDVLQTPGLSYSFIRGSSITFSEPIPKGSNVKVYVYKGYTGDTFNAGGLGKLKIGDNLQLQQDFYSPPPLAQKKRIIKEIVTSDVLRTNVYNDLGLSDDSSQKRSVTWTRQKVDLIIDGDYVSKSRLEQNSGIGSFSIITQNVTVGVGTTVGITTTLGTFVGFCTNIIGINTNVGVGSLIQVGDYVEGTYVAVGATIVSIGASNINIGAASSGTSTGSGNLFLGITSYSSSPTGINTIPLIFYRKS